MPFVPVFFQIKTVSFCCDSAYIVGLIPCESVRNIINVAATINILVMSRQAMPEVSIDDSEKDDRIIIHSFMKELCRRDDEDKCGINTDQISKGRKNHVYIKNDNEDGVS
jgi:hypothetical protein